MSEKSRPQVFRGAVAIGRIAGEVAGAVFSRHGLGHGEIAAQWTEIAGPELAAVSRPQRLAWPRPEGDGKGGGATLTVAVEGPRAVELQHAAPGIIGAINTLYGYRAVGRLRLVQAAPGQVAPRHARRRPVEAADPARFETIRSPALRDALARLDAASGRA